jgi:putative Ca2+/H+ antiporter (TMEM165/GDT1 family)
MAPGGLWLLPAAAAQGAGAVQSLGAFSDAAWAQALSLIFVSEIGDKTFFIAAILAARASRILTFVGCGSALAFMTAASVAIGQIFHAVPDSFTRGLPLDDIVATLAFLFFGVRSLLDAAAVEDDGAGIQEEREDAEKTLAETDGINASGWNLVREAFVLTTVAEIGDRSQIATIALSAAANPVAVFFGGTVGHLICTGMAVLGGAFISRYLSERAIGTVGGVLFIGFGVTTGLTLLGA